jgi:DNA repair exonuclease SbcCD ATPase subunit
VIRFRHLHFENAGFYKEVDFPLDKQGAVFIGGKNGAGKSFIFTILCNIVFGVSPLGGQRKQIAENNYFGQVDLDIEDKRYIIQQFFNHKKLGNGYRIYENGKNLKIAGGIPKCESFIRNLIPITSEEYYNFHFLTQDNFHTLIYGKPSDHSAFFSAAFRLDVYDEIRQELKNKLSKVNTKINEIEGFRFSADTLKEELSTLPEKVLVEKKLSSLHKKLKAIKLSSSETNRRIAVLQDTLSKQKNRESIIKKLSSFGKIVPLDKVLKEKESIRIKANNYRELTEKGKRRKSLLLEVETLSKNLGYQKDSLLEDIEKEIMALRLKASEANKIQKRVQYESELKIQQAKIKDNGVEEKIEKLNKEKISAEIIVKKSKKEIKSLIKLKGKAICTRCLRPLDSPKYAKLQISKREESLKKRESDLISISRSLKNLKEQLEAINRINALQIRIEEAPKGKLIEKKELAQKINSLSLLISKKEKLEEEFANFNLAEHKIAILKLPEIERNLEELEKLEEESREAKTLENQLKDIDPVDMSVGLISRKIEKLEKKRIKLSTSNSKIGIKIGKYETELERILELNRKLKKLIPKEEKIKLYEYNRNLLTTLHSAYAPDKLKLDRIHAINNVVVNYANTLAPMIFDYPIMFSAVKKMGTSSIYFTGRTGKEYSVRFLSGGYKKRLMLLLIPVISGLVPTTKRSNMIVLDEVDANVDDNGAELFGNTLIPFLKRKYDSLFVLSPANMENKKIQTRIPLEDFDKILYTDFGKLSTIKK